MLTEAQIAKYHEDGYVIPDFTMPDDVIEAIQERHAALLKKNPEFRDYCAAILQYDEGFADYCRNVRGPQRSTRAHKVYLWAISVSRGILVCP